MQTPASLEGSSGARRAARTAATVCLVGAVLAVSGGAIAGQPLAGVAVGFGLLLSALNAALARRLLGLGAAFTATSMLRLVVLTLVALATGPVLGWPRVFLVAAGIALGQLALSGAAAREVLRVR